MNEEAQERLSSSRAPMGCTCDSMRSLVGDRGDDGLEKLCRRRWWCAARPGESSSTDVARVVLFSSIDVGTGVTHVDVLADVGAVAAIGRKVDDVDDEADGADEAVEDEGAKGGLESEETPMDERSRDARPRSTDWGGSAGPCTEGAVAGPLLLALLLLLLVPAGP